MRVLLHEFAGYAFVLDLARELARRDHEVIVPFCPDVPSGKGATTPRSDDPRGLSLLPHPLGRPFERYAPARRLRDETVYGRSVARTVRAVRPDVVVSANAPLVTQRLVQRAAAAAGAPFVFWLQDLLGVAIADQLARRIPVAGAGIGHAVELAERRLLRRSSHVVAISPAFVVELAASGHDQRTVTLLENWAPLHETPVRPHDNQWSRRHGLHTTTNLVYAGTLGLKHDPDLIVALADALATRPDCRVVLVSEGVGADHVAAAGEHVLVLPYQPYDELPDVLGSASVLLALLEPAAGRFSVPSKVLTHQCAGRPTLAAMPATNAAARMLESVGSGVVVDPGDRAGFVDAALRLVDDPDRRATMGAAARAHAEASFDLTAIADSFEEVLGRVVSGHRAGGRLRRRSG